MDAWGHTLTVLMGNLPDHIAKPSDRLVTSARILDKFYIPTRYPIGFESGAPTDFYTAGEAQNDIEQAEAILEYCRRQIN